ncbi:MAG: hypothetical protein JW839_04605 [Candidatus Lokiarchaeota archaeon]|nr:hypothetical protein [Candidatus Lokiarchaeota archaeon]
MDAEGSLRRPGRYLFPAMISRLARKGAGREPGFYTYGEVLFNRLRAEATRKRKAYPRLLATLRGEWASYKAARMAAGFAPSEQNPLPAADFIAANDQHLFMTWFTCMFRFDPRRLSFEELPGRGESDYNGLLRYAFNDAEAGALADAVRMPGATVHELEKAIPQLLFQIFSVLANALEGILEQPYTATYEAPVVQIGKDGVVGQISFKLRQN